MRNICAKSRKLSAHARCHGPGQHANVLPRGAGCAVSRAIVASCPQAQGRPDTEVRANERWAPQTATSEPRPILSRDRNPSLLVCRKRPGHDETLRFLTKRIRMEWTHAKSNRNFIVHVMQHKNDPEWLRTVILSVAQQQNTNNHQKITKNIEICKFTAFRLHPNKSRTPADNTGRYGALLRTLPDAIARNRGRYRTLWGPFADAMGRYLAAFMTKRCRNTQICKTFK